MIGVSSRASAPPRSTLFPYTTLFRSAEGQASRFAQIEGAYAQAPEVTRRRLYTDAIEDVLSHAHKVIIDSRDRKSTRLNSSHMSISYAVFCLKKKSTEISTTRSPSHA